MDAWKDGPESARLIAICGIAAAVKYKSALVEPYRKLALKWVDEVPPKSALGRLAPAIFKRLGDNEKYSRWLRHAPPATDASYAAWLERMKAEA